MSKEYRFPEGFWWGSATSAVQIEGAADEDGKGMNVWDYWYQKEPNRFFNGIGSQVTSDFYHRYKEDIKLMKELGHNSFRFSISWSRLIPGGTGKVNEKAVEFYNNVINELLENGIEPFATLFHFDMPIEMQNIGGFENRKVVEYFAEYAKTCFELFGDRVKRWITFNEPIVPVLGGYLYNFHYPDIVDFKRAVQFGYGTVLASARAIEEFKKLKINDAKIGIVLNLSPVYPRSNHPADLKAAELADLFHNRSFLDPSVKGEYPKELVEVLKAYNHLPEYKEEDLELIKDNTVQYLGVNYYQPLRVKAKENMPNPYGVFTPNWFYDEYIMPGRRMNPYRGWEIYEKGIYDLLKRIKDEYGNIECFISENGMGVEGEERFIKDGIIQDDYRIEFIKEHLKWVHKAIEEGCNVKGYHVWTFMDNWSWLNAYKNRYGLVAIDLKTQKRTIKKSGYWFKEVAENNGFVD
ncbi:6-phospho-beta-glucosidase [Caldanaerobacter subterraneus subsp. tengcongensis MB4]|uniref:Beta-glucosidase/6-phospho-beta-glucosidase/beta-galactosidase n=1 Tax=Caldanaerobacter subterraneus subsp. tengcongensis (strain DSM 15242 / JCM 11007 / NBRC 100824 / MB4) TaxID=273068 RepID=Q8RCS4_CALS4|nr:glycoside hydrolase family 1 protein [Caldanaerobacter subterraneus]AAM23630.1 Beta-glucosidase/6-phospho-beta-glucosidase/beta- galactosidase [Caldanaerobacter subterraneus subsp. tengcongensis MB4]MCS3916883.1 6-phospho-beta-glucosidase [Caldanaerobacter subterraneus subsp. tengcongensis MB4]